MGGKRKSFVVLVVDRRTKKGVVVVEEKSEEKEGMEKEVVEAMVDGREEGFQNSTLNKRLFSTPSKRHPTPRRWKKM